MSSLRRDGAPCAQGLERSGNKIELKSFTLFLYMLHVYEVLLLSALGGSRFDISFAILREVLCKQVCGLAGWRM